MLRYVWIALVVLGCKYPDPAGSDAGGGDDGGPSLTTDLIVHVTDSGTRELFLLPGVEAGSLDNYVPAETYPPNTRVFTLGEFVFVATTDGKLLKLAIDGSGLGFTDTNMTLDFASYGITEFVDSWVVIDTKAWYFDLEVDKAFFVDLETMTVLNEVSIGQAHVANRVATFTGAAQRGAELFVSLYYTDPNDPLVPEPELTVLRIVLSNFTLASIIHDSRCIHAQMIGVAPNNSVLIIGDSSYLHDFGTPPAPANCLGRITESNPNAIDTGSNFWMIDDYMDGDVSGSYAGARTPNTAHLWARNPFAFTTLSDYERFSTWNPHTLSIEDIGIHEQISSLVASTGKPGRTFLISETPIFAINGRSDAMPGGTFRSEIGGDYATYSGEVILVARVR